jgi:UDP:flavonoid glycosyltransferase YjiC (YdhE family)
MAETGHFGPVRPLIYDLAGRGFDVRVFTDGRFGSDIERAGAKLVDIFADHPLDRADGESIPFPCRYVTYAGIYAEEIIGKLRAVDPALIIGETFSVIARVAAQVLGVPYINVMTGHNVDPARYLPALQADPKAAISDRCHRAVELLRDRYALLDASPFCYITAPSPHLNISCQTPGFLTEGERKVFEPLAFYGCIPSEKRRIAPSAAEPAYLNAPPQRMRIYACFGTIVPRFYSDVALGVFDALSECLEKMPEARALVSLGAQSLSNGSLGRLARPNVKVVGYADQWAALSAADVFLTHQGTNSTHEAIFHRVPMLAYPFFWDQPSLARRCRELGIAVLLTRVPRRAVTAEDMKNSLQQILEGRKAIHPNLARAYDWERDVIANRPAVLQMIEDLI